VKSGDKVANFVARSQMEFVGPYCVTEVVPNHFCSEWNPRNMAQGQVLPLYFTAWSALQLQLSNRQPTLFESWQQLHLAWCNDMAGTTATVRGKFTSETIHPSTEFTLVILLSLSNW